jgi:predicted NodU family carbamoyl transferase
VAPRACGDSHSAASASASASQDERSLRFLAAVSTEVMRRMLLAGGIAVAVVDANQRDLAQLASWIAGDEEPDVDDTDDSYETDASDASDDA